MRTDVHTHAYHPAVAGKVLDRLRGFGFSPAGTGVVDDLLMRAASGGIERVCIHMLAMTADQTVPANNMALQLARRERNPGEPAICAFGSVHPDFPRWREELNRLEKAGIKGIKIHPPFQNLAFDDPRMYELIEAVQMRFCVMCHLGAVTPSPENPACPKKLRALSDNFPNVAFIAAHLGGYADGDAALAHLAGSRVWLDTSGTAKMETAKARAIVAKHPRERLLFGTDYPLYDPALEIERQQKHLGLSASEMEAVLHAADFLPGFAS